MLNPERDSNTYSSGLIGLAASFVKGRQGLTENEVEAWAEDLRSDESVPYFFSLNRYLFLAHKPSGASTNA